MCWADLNRSWVGWVDWVGWVSNIQLALNVHLLINILLVCGAVGHSLMQTIHHFHGAISGIFYYAFAGWKQKQRKGGHKSLLFMQVANDCDLA